jgi:hypothetical protein
LEVLVVLEQQTQDKIQHLMVKLHLVAVRLLMVLEKMVAQEDLAEAAEEIRLERVVLQHNLDQQLADMEILEVLDRHQLTQAAEAAVAQAVLEEMGPQLDQQSQTVDLEIIMLVAEE